MTLTLTIVQQREIGKVTNEGASGSGIKDDCSSKLNDDRNDDVGKLVKHVARVAHGDFASLRIFAMLVPI